jgi:methylenetetrahydrofolate--tRNA-(uracil-5-)-methyltransferase
MIPGLENAHFERYGQMHRNTYLSAPGLINQNLQLINQPRIFFAGQLSGVEGYMGNIATGLAAGINSAAYSQGRPFFEFPAETMLGSLLNYITNADKKRFQPMKANFGIMPPLENPSRSKQERAKQYALRSINSIQIGNPDSL